MSRRRVVVTGLGCISPVGNTVAEAWANLLAGKSGIAAITRFDASGLNCHFAGEVKNFDIDSYISPKDARAMDTFIHYGIAAAVQAVQDSGLPIGEAQGEEESTRVGVLIGSGIGGLPLIESMHNEMLAKGPRRISPFFVPASIINMISGHVPCICAHAVTREFCVNFGATFFGVFIFFQHDHASALAQNKTITVFVPGA